MFRGRVNSSAPDHAAALIFEAWLKRHVHENLECQWELDWFVTLGESVRQSRVLVVQETKKLADSPCDMFMYELTKRHLDAPQSVGLRLSMSSLRHGRASSPSARSSASDTSLGLNTPATPGGMRQEPARVSAEVPPVNPGQNTVNFPKADGSGTPEPDAAAIEQRVESSPVAGGPSPQELTISPPTLRLEYVGDETRALPQIKLEDVPSREPEVRPSLGALLKSEAVPPEDERVASSSNPAPTVEQITEPRPRHDNQPTEPAPATPLIKVEFYDPPEPGPVEQDPTLDEVLPKDAVVTLGPGSLPAVQQTVHQREPTKEPEQAPSESKTEPLVEPEQPGHGLGQASDPDHQQIEAQNIPVYQPEPQFDTLPKLDQELPQTQPKDDRVAPNSDSVGVPELQCVETLIEMIIVGHDSQPTVPAPAAPGIQVGPYDPLEPGPVERESEDPETDVRGPVFAEVSPGDTVVTSSSESTSVVQEVAHQSEPAEEPEQVPLEAETELLVELERPVPKLDQTPSPDHPQNIPVHQPEPQLDTLPKLDQASPEIQPKDEPEVPSSDSAPAPTLATEQIPEPQQRHDNQSTEPAPATPLIKVEFYDPPEPGPIEQDPAPDEVLPEDAAITPGPRRLPAVQQAVHQPELTKEPKQAPSETKTEPLIKPGQPERELDQSPDPDHRQIEAQTIPVYQLEPQLDTLSKLDEVLPQTQPKVDHAVPNSGPALAVEQVPEPQQCECRFSQLHIGMLAEMIIVGHENQPTQSAPVEPESKDARRDVRGPALDVVPPAGVVVVSGPGSSPAVQETVHQPELAKEPEQASSETKVGPPSEPEEATPKLGQAPSAAHPRVESRNIPVQQPEPQLDTLSKPDQVSPKTQPEDEHVVPSFDSAHAPAPPAEQIPEPQRLGHDNQPTEPAPVAPQSKLEPHDPSEPAPVKQESKNIETDVENSVLDEVSPGGVVVTPEVEETVHQLEPTKAQGQASSETKTKPLIEFERPAPKPGQAPSADHPRVESQNMPVQQPEPQLNLPEIQLAGGPLPSSGHALTPSQMVEPQLQERLGMTEMVDGSEHGQPAALGHDSAPGAPWPNSGLPDPHDMAPKIDFAPDVAVQVSTILPPALESTSRVQETTRQLEPAKEPEQVVLDVQPSQPAPASVPSESLPLPPTVDPVDLGPSPGPQPIGATPVVHIAPDEPQPSVVQAPVETEPAQEPPSSTPEAHPDLLSLVVDKTQQVMASQDESLTTDLDPTGRPDTQANVELPGPGPVTIEIPRERAPAADPEVGDDPVSTPVSVSVGLPDLRKAVLKVDSALDVADEAPVQGSATVPPTPESKSVVQDTTHQLELAKEPERIVPTTRPEPWFDAQPSQPAPVPAPSESPPPIVDATDLGPGPRPQPTHAAPTAYAAPDAEAQPSVVQAPREANPSQEAPNPKPETRPDVSSAVVDETQQAMTNPDVRLVAGLSPVGHPETQPDSKLPGPEPVKPGLPEERAPLVSDPVVDHPVSAPSSASTPEVESVRTPQDTVAPRPQAQPESPTPPDDPESQLDPAVAKANQLSKEAAILVQQFGTYGNVDDLDEAIDAYGQAAELLAPSPDALDVTSYLDLGRVMRVKFEAFYDIEDLDSAFDDGLMKAYSILRSTPTSELYHDVLHELGVAYLGRYLYGATQAAGNEAQRYCELALNAASSPSGLKRAETYSVLSRHHLAQFEYFSRAEDAISALESLDAASEVHPALNGDARYMENRARALLACYQTRRPEYTGFLDEALALARQARDSTPMVTIQHPIASTLLAELLLARYDQSQDQPDLDGALELLERAVRQVPYVRPEQPWVGERLARALVARFVNERRHEDINDAISFLEIALNLTVTNPYRRQARLDAFGGALTLRFRYLASGEESTGDDIRGLMAGVGSM
ncbi:hypothetical protein FRC10_011402 [Ceratobasidium sp. 414]|nr:hypothetical protein FRC10_011402 [Ceratobasidium sp. 414]